MEQTDGLFNVLNDACAIPLENFLGFQATGTETTLAMNFKPMLNSGVDTANEIDVSIDVVTLTVDKNKHKEAIGQIWETINGAANGSLIDICDATNSIFASEYVTGCAIALAVDA